MKKLVLCCIAVVMGIGVAYIAVYTMPEQDQPYRHTLRQGDVVMVKFDGVPGVVLRTGTWTDDVWIRFYANKRTPSFHYPEQRFHDWELAPMGRNLKDSLPPVPVQPTQRVRQKPKPQPEKGPLDIKRVCVQ